MATANKKVSIYVPCYNEVGNVKPMADTLTEIMGKLSYDYEIVFTDNCSTDGTKEILRSLAARDKHIKVLMNSRNYGTDGRSIRNALEYMSGDVLAIIACDFQEPPELIPDFIRYWEEGYKAVCGQKIGSKEGKVKYACRSLFYKLIKVFSETPQYEHISGIKILDKEVVKEWMKVDYDIELRYALADMGYEVKLIPYEQRERRSGKSSYNIWRYLTFAINSMISTSVAPLRLMTVTGFLMSVLSFIIGVVYLILKLLLWDNFQAGMAPVLIGMFFLGSVQLFFLGIIGEYIGVILRKVTRQPDVIVSEKMNFDEDREIVTKGED
ncbi:MAG: glycosyltransferase family 2 protein [Lachnospiraceae bacterium]|nr:glycosyltransferase family 2 protein [Lachnospiraceae bacterium]